MKREQFLIELKEALSSLPPEDRQDILRDQEEYIREAVSSGRNEEDVIAALGTPYTFAANLSIEAKLQKAEGAKTLSTQMRGTMSAVLAILALAPLNLIFVLGPFMALFACNLAGWASAFAVLIASLAAVGVWLFKLIFLSVGFATHLSSLLFILGWIGLGVLGIAVMVQVTRFFFKGTLAYLRWNLNLIRGKA